MCEWMWNVKFSGTIPGSICNLLALSCHSLKYCLGDRLWPTRDLGGVSFGIFWRPLSHQGALLGTFPRIFSGFRFLLGKWKRSLAPSWFCMPFFSLHEIPWRHKVWSGDCCLPRPILNHDKVAGASVCQEERDNWGVAGVSRANSKSVLEDSQRGCLPVPF